MTVELAKGHDKDTAGSHIGYFWSVLILSSIFTETTVFCCTGRGEGWQCGQVCTCSVGEVAAQAGMLGGSGSLSSSLLATALPALSFPIRDFHPLICM